MALSKFLILRACEFFPSSAASCLKSLARCIGCGPLRAALVARGAMSEPECLFGELPEQVADGPPEAEPAPPRLREPQRDQIELRVVDLDGLLPVDHPARAVWAFVEQLDLSALLDAIKARERQPGHPPANPQIPMALWLYATIDAVGSARALARLCETHVAYQWICGGVSMNHHTLSDFRVAHVALLDRLLAQGVAALVTEGLVRLERLAQDGVRVRAAAGASSYRRRPRLEQLLRDGEARVAALKAELESDPAASTARQRAARQRAARERVKRTNAALERMKKLEAERARRAKTHKQGHGKAEGAAGLDDRCRSAGDKDGRRRLSSGLQRAVRQRSGNPGDCRSGDRHHWLGSRPDRANAGANQPDLRANPKAVLGRRRLHQTRGYRASA